MDNEEPSSSMTRTESRLRRLAGRKTTYDGQIVAIARAWVSRDGRWHLFAARYLDFAMLTPDHLVLCSTGFFTRHPRRQVFREALGRLEVTAIDPEPVRTVRVVGNFNRPIRLELRPNEAGITFARELLACTRPTRDELAAKITFEPATAAAAKPAAAPVPEAADNTGEPPS